MEATKAVRRRKSAKERREQRWRAEGRVVQSFLWAFACIESHRGGQFSALAVALRVAMNAKEAMQDKEAKEEQEAEEAKEADEAKDAKEAKEATEEKEAKEAKEAEEAKEVHEAKEAKEAKDAKDEMEAKEAEEAMHEAKEVAADMVWWPARKSPIDLLVRSERREK